MKYYKIRIKIFYPNDRIASTAVGDKISDISIYLKKIHDGEILKNVPTLDYFYLESYDQEKYWEWQIFDVHNFRGSGIHTANWFISERLKKTIEFFQLPSPHQFYPCRLLYKKRKFEYHIFQFSGQHIANNMRANYINWNSTIFINPIDDSFLSIKSLDEFIEKTGEILKESGYTKEIVLQRLYLNSNLDFFPMGTYLNDDIVSENFKNTIENTDITGFEFSELDYEVIVSK